MSLLKGLFFLIYLMALSCNIYAGNYPHNVVGQRDIVSSEKMAEELAEVYIKHVYGESAVARQKPFIIIDKGEEWKVDGQPPEQVGGSFTLIISKVDGRVILMTHSQ